MDLLSNLTYFYLDNFPFEIYRLFLLLINEGKAIIKRGDSLSYNDKSSELDSITAIKYESRN
jgi:hypothetical protein